MTKDEILEKSRKENNSRDIYDLDVQKKAAFISVYTGVLLAIGITIVNWFLKHIIAVEILMLIFGMETILFSVKFIKMHKTHELFVAISYFCGFAFFTALWIKNLVG